jgi:hypothetical protein
VFSGPGIYNIAEVWIMKRILLSSCSVIAALLLMSVVGLSQDQDREVAPKGGKGVCKADVDTFCKGIKPGGGRIWACLKSNEADLSQPCRDQMAQARERGKEFHQACRPDVKKFCKNIPHGKGRVISCLKSHEADLTEPCRAFFKKN